jgi:hypothetical protein
MFSLTQTHSLRATRIVAAPTRQQHRAVHAMVTRANAAPESARAFTPTQQHAVRAREWNARRREWTRD